LFEHELYWLFVLLLFVVSVYIGTTITNFFYRDVSWSGMIMTDYWNYRGMRGSGLEMYLCNIGFISFIVFILLNACICALFVVPSGG